MRYELVQKDSTEVVKQFEAEELRQTAIKLYQSGKTPADIFIETGVCLLIEEREKDDLQNFRFFGN